MHARRSLMGKYTLIEGVMSSKRHVYSNTKAGTELWFVDGFDMWLIGPPEYRGQCDPDIQTRNRSAPVCVG